MKNMDSKNSEKDLKACVLGRLEENNLNPKPKILFIIKEVIFWFLWLLSTGIGAVAIAVTLFVVGYRQYALYEATHDSFFTFMMEVLPFIWILLLLLMVLLSIYNLRHVSRGYRYSLLAVMTASISVSFIGGVFLHISGVGFSVDRWLGHSLALYNSQEKIEIKLWQKPVSGRLVGKAYEMNGDNSRALFVDTYNTHWDLVTTELGDDDMKELGSGRNVKVIGQVLQVKPPKMHVCGVFTWFYDDLHSRDEMRKQREIMIERAKYYLENKKEVIIDKLSLAPESNLPEKFSSSPCHNVAVFERFNHGY